MNDIRKFFLPHCKRYGFSLNYIADKDTYFLHLNGRAIMTFNTKMFYEVPKAARIYQLRALKNSGLVHNLGEPGLQEQIFMEKKVGKKIISKKDYGRNK